MPPLGSGLGGLDWRDVRLRIDEALGGLEDVHVIVFEPHGAPEVQVTTRSREVAEYDCGPRGAGCSYAPLSRRADGPVRHAARSAQAHVFHARGRAAAAAKICSKGPYGPYAENLRHVLRAIEGHLVSGYADGGDAPGKQLELVPGAVADAEAFLRGHPGARNHFDRVANLVEGFETPFGLELLSTVHWVASRESVTGAEDAAAKVYAWNDRKKRFSPRQIGIAFETLSTKGWLQTA